MQTAQSAQAKNNQVDGLLRPNRIQHKALLKAMESTDRSTFLPAGFAHLAGADAPIPLGNGRGLTSPLTLAHLLQNLDLQPGQHVLVLAANTGFSAALCATLVGPQGHVTVVEDTAVFLPALKKNLQAYPNTTVLAANPATYKAEGGFDAVLLDATIQHLPAQATSWLKEGATLATLMLQKSGLPGATLFRKHGKALFEEVLFDVKGQTEGLEDSRFALPQSFAF